MNVKQLYFLLMCAGLAAFVGAGMAVWVTREREATPSASAKAKVSKPTGIEARQTNASAEADELATRVLELERRVAKLQSLIQRLVLGQGAEAAGERAANDVNPAASAELDIADPVFEAAVADIIERDVERRRNERQEKRRQKREQEIQNSVTELGQTLRLAPNQEAQLTELLTKHWEQLSEARDDSDPNISREQRRANVDALVKATEGALLRVLTPRQADQYRELNPKQKPKLGGRSEREGRPEPESN